MMVIFFKQQTLLADFSPVRGLISCIGLVDGRTICQHWADIFSTCIHKLCVFYAVASIPPNLESKLGATPPVLDSGSPNF